MLMKIAPTCDGAELRYEVDHAGLASTDISLLWLGDQQRLVHVGDGFVMLLETKNMSMLEVACSCVSSCALCAHIIDIL